MISQTLHFHIFIYSGSIVLKFSTGVSHTYANGLASKAEPYSKYRNFEKLKYAGDKKIVIWNRPYVDF